MELSATSCTQTGEKMSLHSHRVLSRLCEKEQMLTNRIQWLGLLDAPVPARPPLNGGLKSKETYRAEETLFGPSVTAMNVLGAESTMCLL